MRMIRNRWWTMGTAAILGATLQTHAAVTPHIVTGQVTSTNTVAHLTVFGGATTAASFEARKLDGSLKAISQHYSTISAAHPLRDLHEMNPAARFRLSTPLTTPQILVDAITLGNPQSLKASLESLGLEDAAVFSNDVGGWLPVDQLANVGALAELHFVRAAMPRTRSSSVATQGDFVQMSSAVRAAYPTLTGSGVTVGVLSDSFNCMAAYEAPGSGVPASGYNGYAEFGFTATYATDQQPSSGQAASTSALPAGVNVLEEANCLRYGAPNQTPFGDEGRAILQIVHAVAPGAGLAFYTAVNSEADFANGIKSLAAAGAKVIDDDVGYPDEPFFQDGLIAQAINTVAAQGVVYFSSAGNDGANSYENTTPSFTTPGSGMQSGEKLLNFDPSGATTTTSLPLSIPQLNPGDFISLVVGWDQPFVTGAPASGGATSSIDICVSGAGGDLVTDNNAFTPVNCTGPNSLGGDPIQVLILGNPANASGPSPATTAALTIGLAGGTSPPGRIKFLLADNGAGAKISSSLAPGGPAMQGHPMAATAAAVGAAFYFNTPQCGTSPATLHTYSSAGGDPTLFDVSGARLATPQIRNKPDFVAPDGANNTILGATFTQSGRQISTTIAGCQDNASFPNFFGTSAAGPHAAAAAALLLQANPTLTNTQIIQALQNTALPMTRRAITSVSGYDYDDGHGFIQVEAAVAALPANAPSISVSPTTITAGGSATLTWLAVNSSGCTASGGWTGAQASGGSITVTPNAAGAYTYTLTCSTAGGTVTNSASLMVNAASSGGNSPSYGGGHGGGALDLTSLLALGGVLFATRRIRTRRAVP
jgi:Subtilase family